LPKPPMPRPQSAFIQKATSWAVTQPQVRRVLVTFQQFVYLLTGTEGITTELSNLTTYNWLPRHCLASYHHLLCRLHWQLSWKGYMSAKSYAWLSNWPSRKLGNKVGFELEHITVLSWTWLNPNEF
jgi:hypothetical protein